MKSYDYNKYFFIKLPEPAMEAIMSHTIEKTVSNAAKLYDGSYLIKLPMKAKVPNVLKSHTAYTHSEMKIEKAKREKDRPE